MSSSMKGSDKTAAAMDDKQEFHHDNVDQITKI